MKLRPVSRETLKAVQRSIALGLNSLRADVFQTLSEWAADHFKLAGESSHQKGGWIAWSFQVGILDFMSDDRIEELDVMKSKRVGYTKMITAFVGYNIAHRRRKQALWQPTDDDRDSYVKSEIDPILEARDGVPAVQAARRKGGGNDDTIKMKKFRDSVLHLLGGKAKRAYRRITVAVAILDEWSAFDQTIEKSGDPGGLAKGRLEGAPYPKFVGGSTPGVKQLCHVERAALNAEGFVRFYIECKHCGVEHPLAWGGKGKLHGFKWERGNPNDPLAIIEEEACAVARSFGVAVAEEAAASLMERLIFRLGRAHVYLPKRTAKERARVPREIVQRFNGRNLLELAREYELTPRYVRHILATHSSRYKSDPEGGPSVAGGRN